MTCTFKYCHKIALKYKYKRDFIKNKIQVYNCACRNGWLDKICGHMIPLGNLKKRMIYAYEFPDKSVYIGLTYDETKRKYDHFKDKKRRLGSSVYKRYLLLKIMPIYKKITNYIEVTKAQKIEDKTIKKYKKEGWEILNIKKAGGLGGGKIIWNQETFTKEALKYKTRWEFGKKSPAAYRQARKSGCLDEVCAHMPHKITKKAGFWNNKEECKKVALLCGTRTEFSHNYNQAYAIALKNGWLDELCSHMAAPQKPKGFWSKKRCRSEALKYDKRGAFAEKSKTAYIIAYNNGWLDEICRHMKTKPRFNYKHNKELCHQEALKYNTRSKFCMGSRRAYVVASENKWLNEICGHMTWCARWKPKN